MSHSVSVKDYVPRALHTFSYFILIPQGMVFTPVLSLRKQRFTEVSSDIVTWSHSHRTLLWLTPELTLLAAILVYPPRTGEFHEGNVTSCSSVLGLQDFEAEMPRRVAHLPTLSGCKHQLHGAAFCFFRFYCIQQRAYVFLVGAHPNGQLATVGEKKRKRKSKGNSPLAHLDLHKNIHFDIFPPLLKYHMANTSWNMQKKKKVNRRKKLLIGLSTDDFCGQISFSL